MIAELENVVKADAQVKRRPLRWFIPMPARMALDTGISHAAFRLASVLLHFEGERGCFPSQSRLSKALGMSEDSVARYLRELELYGFLTRKKRTGFHNMYLLTPLYERPIERGSILVTGELEIENAPKRRPPSSRELRTPRVDAKSPPRPLAAVRPIAAGRRRVATSAEFGSAAAPAEQRASQDLGDLYLGPPAHVVNNDLRPKAIKPPAQVRLPQDNTERVPPASVRVEVPAFMRLDQPYRCGSNNNPDSKNHQHQDAGSAARSGGGEEEKITGLGLLQRANVNVGGGDLGVHEGRHRSLNDKELANWAVWVTSKPASGIANKAAFCATKVRMGCTVEDVFPLIATNDRRDAETAGAALVAAERDALEQQRIDRADTLIAELCKADRQLLRDRALRDSSVWIARNARSPLFAVMLAAAERRLVLGETEPCSTNRDLSAYPQIPPL